MWGLALDAHGHLWTKGCTARAQNVIVEDFEIYVDVEAQKDIYRTFDALEEASGLPIFPLNTGALVCRSGGVE